MSTRTTRRPGHPRVPARTRAAVLATTTVAALLGAALVPAAAHAVAPVGTQAAGTSATPDAVPGDAEPVTSPNGDVTAHVWLDASGVPTYELSYAGHPVLEPSSLGLTTSNAAYTAPFTLVDATTATRTGTWHDDFGTLSTVPDSYSELTVTLESSTGHLLAIVARAYDAGFGFRYVLGDAAGSSPFTISSEQSTFNLVDDATVLAHPNGHQQNTPTTTAATGLTAGMTYARPLTVLGDGYAATITESDQLDYTRMFLTPLDLATGTLVSRLDGTTGGVNLGTGWLSDTVSVDVSQHDFSTPWRTVVLGQDEGELLDHGYLVKSLAAPSAIADTSWITPGSQFRGTTLTTTGGKQAVDFAAARGIDYVLFDAGWYGPEGSSTNLFAPVANFDPATIGSYAKTKGVKIVLYVNYRALWSHYQAGTLDDWFQYASDNWNVGGIKFGFVPVGSQIATTTVYDWVSLAADAHLVVDIHDELLPTGVERTYPNLLTTEGVFGDEENPTATQDLTSLFTRGVVGPADHTWCFMLTRNTSRSFRYASTVVWSTGLQTLYWYDSGPTTVNPAPELWDNLPASWDETRTLEASVTDHATVARRSGDEWYVGAISAVNRTATIDLSFLTPGTVYRASTFEATAADQTNGLSSAQFLVDSTTVLDPQIAAAGGYALRLAPATPAQQAELPRYEQLDAAASALQARIDAIGTIDASNLIAKRTEVEAIRAGVDALPGDYAALVTNQAVLVAAEATIDTLVGSVTDMQNIRLLAGTTTFAREGTPADGNYLNAFDSNPTTYYDGRAGSFFGVHTSQPVVLAGIGYTGRATFESRMVGNVIEGSNDGTTWTKLYTITTVPKTNPASQSAVMTSPEARQPYTYFRYAVGSAQFGNVADLEFYTAPQLDYTVLDTLLAEASALHQDDYTAGWDALTDALVYARAAREGTYAESYVDITTSALRDAIAGLVLTPTRTTQDPTVVGDAVVGAALTATPGAWLPSIATTSVRWERDGTPVAGATAWSYTLTDADYGHVVAARITGTAGASTASATASAGTVTEHGAPSVAIDAPATAASGWYTTAPRITVTGTDDLSGVSGLEYRIDAGAWSTYTAPVLLSEGTTVVEARATDHAGNLSALVARTLKTDTLAPVSAATLDPVTRAITLTAADDTSGIDSLQYRLGDASAWTTATGTVPLGEAATTVTYRAVDVAGNAEAPHTLDVPSATAPLAASATAASSVPGTYGTATRVTARVLALTGTATGTVTVREGDVVLGTAALVAGRSDVLLPATLAVGTHHVTVEYSGDASLEASSDTADVVVAAATATLGTVTTTLTGAGKGVRPGRTVRATLPAGVPAGAVVTYQWRRDGKAITGARGASLRLGAADVGHDVHVVVSVTATGYHPATAASAARHVTKATATLTVTKTKVLKKKRVRVTVRIASTVRVTGKVTLLVGKSRKTLSKAATKKLSTTGKVTLTSKKLKPGRHAVQVRYAGSATVAKATSATTKARTR